MNFLCHIAQVKKLGLRKSRTMSELTGAFSHEGMRNPELCSGALVLLQRILIYIKAQTESVTKMHPALVSRVKKITPSAVFSLAG